MDDIGDVIFAAAVMFCLLALMCVAVAQGDRISWLEQRMESMPDARPMR